MALDVMGRVKIGGPGCYGKAYFSGGRAVCTNLQVGVGASGWLAVSSLLSLSNTTFVVSGDVTVGDPFTVTAGTGLITNQINGVSSGIDMTGTLSITNGGSIYLNFMGPPADPESVYWGLRITGNQTDLLASMHTDGKLTWSTGGLTAKQMARFGINYDRGRNFTYVGVKALVPGTIVSVW